MGHEAMLDGAAMGLLKEKLEAKHRWSEAARRFRQESRGRQQDEPWPTRADVAQEEWADPEQVGDLGNADDDVVFAPEDEDQSASRVGVPTPWAVARHKEVEAWNRLEALMRDRSKEDWPPTSADDWEWSELWDEMVRAEFESRRKVLEPDQGDRASPDFNPEIAEWERHWPSEPPKRSKEEPQAAASGPPSRAVLAIRVVKQWIWRRKP